MLKVVVVYKFLLCNNINKLNIFFKDIYYQIGIRDLSYRYHYVGNIVYLIIYESQTICMYDVE